uniref:Uncharacterized protein n=1 Tax=virus sp. ctFlR8 TaxID=2825811 RepID=A0A8S5RMZ6_9VIRU|nr:MAG TPA: hypothetical protein [virus sp. ctFlR8]
MSTTNCFYFYIEQYFCALYIFNKSFTILCLAFWLFCLLFLCLAFDIIISTNKKSR